MKALYTPSYARAVRGRRGDDVRAERCPRVGRDQTRSSGSSSAFT